MIRSEWKQKFIAALGTSGNITTAAKSAGIARTYPYEVRSSDADFAQEWDSAMEEAADLIEAEARRRAVEGVDEPVFYQGEKCGVIRKYSDALLITLLRAAKPEKYRERYDATSGGRPMNADLADAISNLSTLTEAELIRLHQETLGA